MKKIILSFWFISTLSYAQIEKEVGSFNKVTAFDHIDVNLVASNQNKVVLNGNNSEKVELINKNGELKIRMQMLKLMQGDNVSATVYYTNLESVEANEGSRISGADAIKTVNFIIIAKEGAEIKLELNVSRVALKISSGATVSLSGNATNQEAVVAAGAVYEAQNLKSIQAEVTVNAGGEATIFATQFVDAKVRAGGNVEIFGNPKKVNQKTVLGGNIKIVK